MRGSPPSRIKGWNIERYIATGEGIGGGIHRGPLGFISATSPTTFPRPLSHLLRYHQRQLRLLRDLRGLRVSDFLQGAESLPDGLAAAGRRCRRGPSEPMVVNVPLNELPLRQIKRMVDLMEQIKVIIEKHPEGYVAYPVGLKGVIVGEGDTYEEALNDVKSAIRFHIDTFGPDVLEVDSPVLDVFIAETGTADAQIPG